MGQGVKRTQLDCSLTFKLVLVEQIEKGELTYKQHRRITAFRIAPSFWYGCVNMVGRIGTRGLLC